MDKQYALAFLRKHQPMPPDGVIDENLINQYDEVRLYFLDNPDVDSIPLFLNSFGEGDGLGVYQLVEDVLLKHHNNDVVSSLATSLRSDIPSIRYWCAQIAANFPSPDLIQPLEISLNDENVDTREAAITALEQIGGPTVKRILKERLLKEMDEGIIELIHEVLS